MSRAKLAGMSRCAGKASEPEGCFIVLYDLTDPGAWRDSHRHRGLWGKLHTDYYFLGEDHVVMVFKPSPDARWREWERVRRDWILGELGQRAA